MWSPLYFNVTYSTITEQAHNNVVFHCNCGDNTDFLI